MSTPYTMYRCFVTHGPLVITSIPTVSVLTAVVSIQNGNKN